jgi:putative ABC transport system permease protein
MRVHLKLLPFDYAVRNLGRSPLRLAATVGGAALVVLLVVAAAAFVQGMTRSMAVSPENHNVIVLGVGSEESIERSQVGSGVPGQLIGSVRGLKEELGVPFVSPEIHMAVVMSGDSEGRSEMRAMLRGITPGAFLVHPQMEIVEGRAPKAGHDEVIVGMLAADKMGVHGGDVALGSELWFDNRPWEIVGRFRAPATVMEGEVWMPLTDLQVAARRDTLSCVVATLGTAEFADMDVWAKSRLDLEVTVMAESDYYASLQRFYRPVRWMVWGTAVLMAMAGLLGGLNTLYTAFAARTREVGMLQALGYPRRAIVVTIMQESVLAASAGALLACLVAWLLLDGLAVRFSMGVFQLSVDSSAVALGLFAGLLVGVIGSIPPALQCLRLPIPSALKAI